MDIGKEIARNSRSLSKKIAAQQANSCRGHGAPRGAMLPKEKTYMNLPPLQRIIDNIIFVMYLFLV